MFSLGDLVVHYMYGYIGIVTEITNHEFYPYKVLFISPPHEDEDDYLDTEWCNDKEIKPLDNLNEKG